MTPEQFDLINKNIEQTIIKTVNGKIDRIDQKLDDYIKQDNEWKEAAQPTIEMGNNVRGFGKVLAYLLGTAAAIYGAFRMFK